MNSKESRQHSTNHRTERRMKDTENRDLSRPEHSMCIESEGDGQAREGSCTDLCVVLKGPSISTQALCDCESPLTLWQRHTFLDPVQ